MKVGWETTTLGIVAQIGAGNSVPQEDEFFPNFDVSIPFVVSCELVEQSNHDRNQRRSI